MINTIRCPALNGPLPSTNMTTYQVIHLISSFGSIIGIMPRNEKDFQIHYFRLDDRVYNQKRTLESLYLKDLVFHQCLFRIMDR